VVEDVTHGRRLRPALLASALAIVPVAMVGSAEPACAAGEMRVSVVVDFEDLPSPPATSAACWADTQ
jgi:hypothetical protein